MNDVVQKSSQDKNQSITFSEKALSHIKKEIEKQGQDCKGLRFSVSKTGCSGLSYVIDYVTDINETDKHFLIKNWLNVYIAHKAYPYLKGIEVDYVKQGLNYKFSFVNPNQTGACGCGESFTVDSRFL